MCVYVINILIILLIQINLSTSCDKSCEFCLSSSNFEDGTYRITKSGKYCVNENIEFNPLPGTIKHPNKLKYWFPRDSFKYPGCEENKNGAFSLGFFAAITIETSDVEIDLEHHTLSQHKYHYLQQRFFSLIEIGKSAFLQGSGPSNFGPLKSVHNIHIHNGELGLTSHHAIHSNGAKDIKIENLEIFQFEVGGIQFNGFDGIKIKNVEIGPSSINVQPSGYYSNAKFLSFPLYKLTQLIDKPSKEYVVFNGKRKLSIEEIYNNLITSIDIAFRYFIDKLTDNDIENELYLESIRLYSNKNKLPDGSAIYGILLHSRDLAVNGFGEHRNQNGDGEDIIIENVYIHDLILNVNEVPAVYFDKCIHKNSKKKTVIKGPFGDILDVRKMVAYHDMNVIDEGEDYSKLEYVGNPLSDAQIALGLYGDKYDIHHGISGLSQNSVFLRWALHEYQHESYDKLPKCTSFICNTDIMLHVNKGVIGLRSDKIEDIEINGLVIKKLMNKSNLGSYACKDYKGRSNGVMGSDVKGISIYDGDVTFYGNENKIEHLLSYNGDVVGIHLMNDAELYIDQDDGEISINDKTFTTGDKISKRKLKRLIRDDKCPYPNNFYTCNILIDITQRGNIIIEPNPPNGVNKIECKDIDGNRISNLYNSNTFDSKSKSKDSGKKNDY